MNVQSHMRVAGIVMVSVLLAGVAACGDSSDGQQSGDATVFEGQILDPTA